LGKKFIEGMAFGAGFAIAFVAVSWLAWFLITPRALKFVNGSASSVPTPHSVMSEDAGPPFHELTVEEKIKRARSSH
jgi:hypothetical protein